VYHQLIPVIVGGQLSTENTTATLGSFECSAFSKSGKMLKSVTEKCDPKKRLSVAICD